MRIKLVEIEIIVLSILMWSGTHGQSVSFESYDQPIPGSSLQMRMVAVPSGQFLLGSPKTESNRREDEGPQRNLTIEAFWMGAFEVTHDQLNVYLHDAGISQNVVADAVTRPSPQYVDLSWGMGKQGGFPANSMSQKTALMFCRWLYEKTGHFYRLPSEVEWEYACRAGTTTAYFFGHDAADLEQYAWFTGNSGNVYHPTGLKKPNPWGLYDMLGNVMEWTLDHYLPESYEREELVLVPKAVKGTYPKVLRGGSFEEGAADLRSASRFHSDPQWNRRDPQIPKSKWWLTEAKHAGFRVVRPLKSPSEEEIRLFFDSFLK